jgi:hypothetical protein
VNGDICSICCGTERENTIRCPFRCQYLQESRSHERLTPLDPASIPNQEIAVRQSFLDSHVPQISAMAGILTHAVVNEPGALDQDVRDMLESLVRTWRTRQSGLYYDSRPQNAVAARIFDRFRERFEAYARDSKDKGVPMPGDTDALAIVVYLQRLAIDFDNGRRLGRAFLDFLRRQAGLPPDEAQETTPLIHTA